MEKYYVQMFDSAINHLYECARSEASMGIPINSYAFANNQTASIKLPEMDYCVCWWWLLATFLPDVVAEWANDDVSSNIILFVVKYFFSLILFHNKLESKLLNSSHGGRYNVIAPIWCNIVVCVCLLGLETSSRQRWPDMIRLLNR